MVDSAAPVTPVTELSDRHDSGWACPPIRQRRPRRPGSPANWPHVRAAQGHAVDSAGREEARRRHGADFDAKALHTAALTMGGMGLGPLARRLATL